MAKFIARTLMFTISIILTMYILGAVRPYDREMGLIYLHYSVDVRILFRNLKLFFILGRRSGLITEC